MVWHMTQEDLNSMIKRRQEEKEQVAQLRAQLKVGDEVMITEYASGRYYKGTVVKIRRVWIEVQREGWIGTHALYRFRLDTQTDGSSFSGPHFWTMAQWAEREREQQDRAFLRAQGINIGWRESKMTPATLINALRLAQRIGDGSNLLKLIEDYGCECAAGGAGYTSDKSDAFLKIIKEMITGE